MILVIDPDDGISLCEPRMRGDDPGMIKAGAITAE